MAGSGASARAIATRCCSPPESSAGIVRKRARQADRRQLMRGARKSVAFAGEFERHRDVFQRRHGWDQVEGLEDDADIAAAEAREIVLA